MPRTNVVSRVVRVLPGPLLRLLDAWSHRVARQRAERRQRLWLGRPEATAKAASVPYY